MKSNPRRIVFLFTTLFILYSVNLSGQVTRPQKVSLEPIMTLEYLIVREDGESDQDYQIRKKAYNEENNEDYKKWKVEHQKWREQNPNWKEITRYKELVNNQQLPSKGKCWRQGAL